MLFKHIQYIYAAMGTRTLKYVITIFIKMLDGNTFYNENDRKVDLQSFLVISEASNVKQ